MGQEAKKMGLDEKQQLKLIDIVHSEMETGGVLYQLCFQICLCSVFCFTELRFYSCALKD